MLRFTSVFVLFFLICSCGTSTETTNGFTVSIAGSKVTGSGLQDTRVGVYPVEYNPIDSVKSKVDTVTVIGGDLNLSGFQPGYYNILIQKISNDYGHCIENVSIGLGDSQSYSDTLKPTGCVFGKMATTTHVDTIPTIAILEGTPFLDTIRASQFVMNNIPAGSYELTFRKAIHDSSMSGSQPQIVQINSGMQTKWTQ